MKKQTLKTKQNKIGTYLAVTAGVGCAASSANAAVTFYGEGVAAPAGISITNNVGDRYIDTDGGSPQPTFLTDEGSAFTSGVDSLGSFGSSGSQYYYFAGKSGGNFSGGASSGSSNYANISFDGDDGVYESVAQFFFDGGGGGYLIAIATNDAPNAADALSISAGKSLIDAAAVPEPSSLALLALGSAGLIARRRRKAA